MECGALAPLSMPAACRRFVVRRAGKPANGKAVASHRTPRWGLVPAASLTAKRDVQRALECGLDPRRSLWLWAGRAAGVALSALGACDRLGR